MLWILLPQTFELPASACIGQYLRINLHGKRQRQEADYLFYTAICAVSAYGRAPPAPLPALAPWRLHAQPRLHLDSVRLPAPACSRPGLGFRVRRAGRLPDATANNHFCMLGVRRGRVRGGTDLGRGRTTQGSANSPAAVLGASAGAARLGGQRCRCAGRWRARCPAAALGAWGAGGLHDGVRRRRRGRAVDGGVTDRIGCSQGKLSGVKPWRAPRTPRPVSWLNLRMTYAATCMRFAACNTAKHYAESACCISVACQRCIPSVCMVVCTHIENDAIAQAIHFSAHAIPVEFYSVMPHPWYVSNTSSDASCGPISVRQSQAASSLYQSLCAVGAVMLSASKLASAPASRSMPMLGARS